VQLLDKSKNSPAELNTAGEVTFQRRTLFSLDNNLDTQVSGPSSDLIRNLSGT
jgi:hypothetical protein